MYGEGELSFEDDDGTLVRIGRVPDDVRKILAARGQEPRVMPELVDGVIYYPDGRTRVLDDAQPAADGGVRDRVRRFFRR